MQEKASDRPWRRWITIFVIVFLFLVAMLFKRARSRRIRGSQTEHLARKRGPNHEFDLVPSQLQGLSEEEVKARRVAGQDGAESRASRSNRDIWYENLFSIINLDLYALTIVLLLLGRPREALMSAVGAAFSVVTRVRPQLKAKKQLDQVVARARPAATVIRAGRVESIDPSEIVEGDVLVVGPGDQILGDGELVGDGKITVDGSDQSGAPSRRVLRAGDTVCAGARCVSGHAAFRVHKVGNRTLVETLTDEVDPVSSSRPPLQRFLDRVFRVMLFTIAAFTVALVVHFFLIRESLVPDVYLDAMRMVFGVAPSGLFFMVLITYAVATAKIIDLGAIIHRTESLEALAQVTVLCGALTGTLTGARVQLEMADPLEGHEGLTERRVRRILGDIARSTSARSAVSLTLADAFDGHHRPAYAEAPYFSVYGWSAIAFNDVGLRGSFVWGEPEIVARHLVRDVHPEPSPECPGEPPSSRTSAIRDRLMGQAERLKSRGREESAADETERKGYRLSFAYRPEVLSLHDATGKPQLPSDLIPVCTLHVSQKVRVDANETLEVFSAAGVQIKLLSAQAPEMVAATAKRVGLGERDEAPLEVVSGPELALQDEADFHRSVANGRAFAQLTPGQKAEVVRGLQIQGHRVAMLGNGLSDLPALQQADVAIAMQNSSPAVLNVADIVLLADALSVLPEMLQTGQRIVQGLLDNLKLNLTKLIYLAFLLTAAAIILRRFPYAPRYTSFIAIFTLSIPAAFLSRWAPARAAGPGRMGTQVARFALPAAVTVGIAAVAVHVFFRATTGDLARAQLATAYTLVWCGLLLVVFVKPPTKAPTGGSDTKRDWRATGLVIGLFIAILVMAPIPLAQRLLNVEPLPQLSDYFVVGLVVACWALVAPLLSRTWFTRRVVDRFQVQLPNEEKRRTINDDS
jgi:cation-transporting ATPase E